MVSSMKSEDLCELLAQNEERLSELYGIYAVKFPEYKDLWNGLAGEEEQHAKWIRNLASWAKEGLIDINNSRFNIAAINTFTSYVDKEIARARNSLVSLINALSIASYIEDSIIENRFFEVFEGDSPDWRSTLLDLATETNKHRSMIKEALKKAKASEL